MSEILFAMHAPDGLCQISLRSSSGARLADFRAVVGSFQEWNTTIGSPLSFLAANKDGAEHLWVDCDLIVNQGGEGQLWIEVSGNAASMWVSVDGGAHVGVHTSGPRERLAYRFGRTMLPRPGIPLDPRYFKEEGA